MGSRVLVFNCGPLPRRASPYEMSRKGPCIGPFAVSTPTETRDDFPLVATHYRGIDAATGFGIELSCWLAGGTWLRRDQMPGDPTACREHARRGAELAALAATPEEREHFLSLESAWIRFAAELESAEAFLKTMDEIDFKQPYPPEAA